MPQPDWKTAVLALTGQANPPRTSATSAFTPLALQFELREQTPRTSERWRGPTARPVTADAEASADVTAGTFRLGVRPVVRNSRGSWVKSTVAWNSVAHQLNRLNLEPEQHRWFSQFVAMHRATRGAYSGQESDWIYLDDFVSPVLWHLLDEAATLGITFVGTKKDALVTIGTEALVSVDATRARDASAADVQASPVQASDVQLTTRLMIDGTSYPPEAAGVIGTHGIYWAQVSPRQSFVLAPTPRQITTQQRRLLGASSELVIPAPDVPEFLAEHFPRLRGSLTITSSDASVEFPRPGPPTLVLTATFGPQHTLQLNWHWEYTLGDATTVLPVSDASGSQPQPQQQHKAQGQPQGDEAWRNRRTERAILARTGIESFAPTTLRDVEAAEFTERMLPRLARRAGIRVDVVGTKPRYRELTDRPELVFTTIESDHRDWFDLGVLVKVSGHTIPFGPLFKALSKGKKKLLLVDNSYLSLNQPEFDRLKELIEEARELAEWETELRINRHQAGLWAEFEDLADETVQAESWRATVGGLLELGEAAGAPGDASVAPVPLPSGLAATLRPYQVDGFNWLAFLWTHRLGGILADDMGLGKTLQTLALLAHVTEQRASASGQDVSGRDVSGQPFLIVAPTSVVSNWASEAARFTPGLGVRVVTKIGGLADVSGGGADVAAPDVVITSYALFRLDFEAYQAHSWAGLILDEAQFVKNRESQVHRSAVDLNTGFKLALTGTPLENNLLELWSLCAIIAPGLFPSARKFTEDYVRQIELEKNRERLARLKRRIRPLMLRRTKELVVTELPAKQEQTLYIDLAPAHRELYDTFLQRERQKLLGLIEDLDRNRFIVFRSLTLLRMLSLDASLIDPAYAGIPSSKLDALFEQLEDVVAEGHRALIFSQFTSYLRKTAERLDAEGIAYEYLDGSTLRRPEVINRFKSGDAPVFLISLKAGGFGLNLTEADYVFMLDPWWNPASEAQAIDRTHRIGQTKNVMVYRMVATGTIEEKVMALKERKATLFNAVVDDDALFSTALTADDIRGLLER